ncbi:lmo0937 family membrane protein [Cytobacillus sp. NCCP-133]|uniref:lmo0937 family membrane protein n=1 Tax=Cytobacillus sp. NCCP-133 TaxID=766848 RepID=UPI003FA40A85
MQYKQNQKGEVMMLWTIAGILLVLWILGLIFEVAGGIIHLLLIIAAIIIVVNFIKGRASGRG